MNRFFSHAAAATLIALSVAGAARAGDREAAAISVGYGDLNLSTQAGVATLRHRLVQASRSVCGDSDVRQFGSAADMQACRDAAMQDALRDLRRVVASVQTRHAAELASIAPK